MLKKTLLLILIAAMFGCSGEKAKVDEKPNKNGEMSVEELMNLKDNEILVAKFETTMGNFEIQLYAKDVPKTVENFVGLASKKYYDGIIFHRVIADFMIQGGDPTGTGMGGESYWGGKFKNEISEKLSHNEAGILSMANAGPDTNGSQFFITLTPQPHLDGGYSVFGKVISGLDVVQAIGKVKTGMRDKPVEDVVMNSVRIEKREK